MTKRVFTTAAGTRYLKDPVATCIARTAFKLSTGAREFLLEYDEGFHEAVADYQQIDPNNETAMPSMFAGQLCYLAFGEKRTATKEVGRYMDNILSSGHGSVLEHTNFSFLLYGIDRATTHELVRHRVGFGVSQVSQRYVDSRGLRFVLPWEDQDAEGIELFSAHIDSVRTKYAERTDRLMRKYPAREGESRTEHRKRIQSAARSVLSNDVEAPCVITVNARSARHMIALRTGPHADVRIRRPFIQILKLLQIIAPALFTDFTYETLPDGSVSARTPYPKP